MSSTNRGARRIEADFYATPKEAFLPLIPFIRGSGVPVFEPACGDGRLVQWMEEAGIPAHGTDLNRGNDFLKSASFHATIVTNPPFSLAFEFCQKALRCAEATYLLLRLNFLASKKRRDWFRQHEPNALFVLSSRPDFTGGGGDSCDYAWMYWGNTHTGIHHL